MRTPGVANMCYPEVIRPPLPTEGSKRQEHPTKSKNTPAQAIHNRGWTWKRYLVAVNRARIHNFPPEVGKSRNVSYENARMRAHTLPGHRDMAHVITHRTRNMCASVELARAPLSPDK